MKTSLRRVQIDGFGGLHQTAVELSDGLNVVTGDNEAGKSTVMAFIRAQLFGASRGNSVARFAPMNSVTSGGELHLQTSSGPLIVRRQFSGKKPTFVLTDENRAPVAEDRLPQALGHVTEAVYGQFFSFTVDELNDFQHLAEEASLSGALFAASMQGAHQLPKAVDRLNRQLDELYSPKGKVKRISVQLSAAEGAAAKRLALGDRVAQYQQTRAELNAAEQAAREAQAHLKALESRVRHLELLETAERGLRDLAAADAELESLGDAPLERVAQAAALKRLREDELNKGALLTREVDAVERLQGQLEALKPGVGEEWLAAAVPAVEAVKAFAPELKGLEGRLAEARARSLTAVQELQQLVLTEVFENWHRGGTFQLSTLAPGTRPTLESLAQEESELLQARGSAKVKADQLCGEVSTAQRAVAVAAQALEVQSKWGSPEHCRTEASRCLREAHAARPVAPAHRQPLPLLLPALGVAALLVVLAGAAFGGTGAAAMAVISFAGIAALAWWGPRLADSSAAGLAEAEQASARLLQEAELWRGRSAQIENATQADRSARVALELATAQWSEAEATYGETQGALERLGQRTQEALNGLASRPLMPAEALVWLQRFEVASQVVSASQRAERDAETLLGQAQEALQRLWALANEVQSLSREARPGIHEAEALTGSVLRFVAHERLKATQRESLTLQLTEARARRVEADALVAAIRQQAAELLERAGADSDEALETSAARAERAERVKGERKATVAALERQSRASVEVLSAELAKVDRVSAELQLTRQTVEGAQAALAAALELQGRLAQQLASVETDGESRRLRAEEDAALASAELSAREYAVKRLALQMLEEARGRFEREQQPRLIQQTAALFSRLTAGRYRTVVVGVDKSLSVVDASGQTYPLEVLSRGARELLLIALRFALVDDFGERCARLPLLMDDVFVNVDPQRMARVVDALVDSARRQQVVVFSCQPHVVAALQARGASVTTLAASPAQLTLLPQGGR